MTVSKIRFHEPTLKAPLRNRKPLKRFIEELFKNERQHLESLDYIFCSDSELLDIIQQFLNHNDLTDIITFDMSEGSQTIGEIYISVERVLENAHTYNTTSYHELHRVIFHGALHLCGYLDKSPGDEALMRRKEDEYLSRYLK